MQKKFPLAEMLWTYGDFTNLLVQKLVKITQKNVELAVYMKTSLLYLHFYRIHGQYWFLFLHLEKTHCFELFLVRFGAADLQNSIYTQGISYTLNFSHICPHHLQQATLFLHMPTPFTASYTFLTYTHDIYSKLCAIKSPTKKVAINAFCI